MKTKVELTVPESLRAYAEGFIATTPEARMQAVIDWSRGNVERAEGPFAAGVFNLDNGSCIAAGVNRVISSGCSVAHGEMMALMLAQQTLEVVNLAEKGRFVLTTSAQPCSQCFGAIPWSGVEAMEFGATRDDVEAIGFDEGPCPENWRELLEGRNIRVTGPVMQKEAAAVLQEYARSGGNLY
ncbi:nucleoside deaminase [Kiritimatiellaeota bacterium B1221]|nr:nucleoside deaminase [Kiritimatiellaeota bacterium B1221]